ncbi:PH domain-containing protein [Paenarthrobacter histidinolovorans]|uniref:Membrane protein n=1 Tax=Paenarthrobacter histidinolovorans TaxID=43664 RepID=A0ABW8ND78_9MICC
MSPVDPAVALPDKAVDGGWKRVHPASPFVRGWVALAAVGFFFSRDAFERMLQGRDFVDPNLSGRVPWLLAGGAVVLLLTVGGFILSWYFTRYQVAEGFVRVNTGFLFKQQRQARLDRVQAIDIVQPLLARIFGLAELKFEVADAGESAVRLAYLPIDQAKQLRASILAQAAGVVSEPGSTEEIREAPEHVVLSVPPGRLLGSLLLSEQTVGILIGAAVVVSTSVLLENTAIFLALIPGILGIGASYWSAFNKGYNFTAAISPDGIRLRYGLLDTQAQTLPPGRIQAVMVRQPPIWRLFGWYRMHVNVAGYGAAGNSDGAARTMLLPVGLKSDVLRMMSLVLPDPGVDEPAAVFNAGLEGLAPAGHVPAGTDGFVTTPRRARLLAPLGWRRNGFLATGTALLIRSGRWWRTLVMVPHQRTQSMALHQGPLARRFAVADLVLHTTAGPVIPRVFQAGVTEAVELFDRQAARAREARKRQTSEQWLAQVAPQAPEVAAAAAQTEEPRTPNQEDRHDG